MNPPAAVPVPPSRAQALAWWLRLGCIGFGGPAGQIALMHRELVERRRWVSEGRFLHALNYCMVLPGPEAQQLATYLGWLLHGTWGGVAAGCLFVLPSLLLLLALSWVYLAWGHVAAVAGLFMGIKPAVTALVAHAATRIGARALRRPWLRGVAVLAFAALSLGAPFPVLVLAAALAGVLAGRRWPEPAGVVAPPSSSAPAVLDDHAPPPQHARFLWQRCARVLATCLGLWVAAFGALLALQGPGGLLPAMAWFFTKAALLTFGGAYAVLPYVWQAAVDRFHWLTTAQMMDGLALGETTPGPLIMVVSYVGFVGGWGEALARGASPVTGAVAASLVVTFFTFLPSFLFILAGAPLVEASRDTPRLAAPMAAVTAAVSGVIAHLALKFAGHALWPAGLAGPLHLPSLLIGLGAAVALFRWRLGAMTVIVASALAGLGWTLAA